MANAPDLLAALARRGFEVAGAAWEARDRAGALSDQLRAVAQAPALAEADRAVLTVLASLAAELEASVTDDLGSRAVH